MTRQIIVDIEPDEDGKRCGKCPAFPQEDDDSFLCHCRFSILEKVAGKWGFSRGPECLAAERKLTALVEAAQGLLRCSCEPECSEAREALKAALKGLVKP